MPSLEIESILAPVSADEPSGIDLEYDGEFAELERSAQGKPDRQIGSTIVPAEEPDWGLVQRQATALLGRSKDLRVAAQLTRALLRTNGWWGLAQGLGVLRGIVDRYWERAHPRLDPDDNNDPTMRINILTSVADGALVSAVRTTPLIASRTMGRFSLKDLEIALGEATPANGTEAASMNALEAAVMDCDLAVLEDTLAAVRGCTEALAGLEVAVAARVDSALSPTFGKLSALIHKAETFLGAKLLQRAPASAAGGVMDGTGNGAAGQGAPLGEIRSRQDVIRALDRICAYYEKNEPSSPVPLFMARCKRLVMMSFVDIVRELVPDAVAQVEVLRGRSE
ncbi:MAG TPA: type VI secretion system protein TssA [Polyangia bacterium]|nr:type VI secretion system protein TssA [Polyangia bacterium]